MKNWQQSNNSYFLRDITSQVKHLPIGVYTLKEDKMIGLYLDHAQNNFGFTHKIYGKDTNFINRCIKSYNNTTGNLGVLLSGIQGTGKSVTAKLICNELNLPVISITDEYDDLDNFLSEIEQDCIILIDEYEKIFEKSHMLLSIMDGVSMSKYRRVFILTTNKTYINENLLNRPSRIRYSKTYGNLELLTINEIIDDLLIYQEFKEDLIDSLKLLHIITIDILISIINEINIHNEPLSNFYNDFNVELTQKYYDVFDEDNKCVFRNVELHHNQDIVRYPLKWKGNDIYVKDSTFSSYLGEYKEMKEGVWIFENEEGISKKEVKYIFKPALNVVFGY